MDTEEFMRLGSDTIIDEMVPRECDECAYLRIPNAAHPEYYCNLVMCSNHKNVETPNCEMGRVMLDECKVTDSDVMDLVFTELEDAMV